MTAVQRHALRAPAVRAAVQLGDALQKRDKGIDEDVAWGGTLRQFTASHPLLFLHQLRRKILMKLLLLYMSCFYLHPLLEHVDVVGLSVHCREHGSR